MNPLSEDVKDKLVANNFGVFADTTDTVFGIFISREPDLPSQSITIYDTGAPAPGSYADRNHPPTDFSACQVRVRAPVYLDAFRKIRKISDFLHQIDSFNILPVDSAELEVHYSSILLTSGPLFLEKDVNDRHIWVANFKAFREEVGF